jgi:hypothetical protein
MKLNILVEGFFISQNLAQNLIHFSWVRNVRDVGLDRKTLNYKTK